MEATRAIERTDPKRREEQSAAASHMWRVKRAKDRLLAIKPAIDLENARILTESFMKTEGEPMVVRKATGFKEQCERKTISILEDELIVGCIGSKLRGGVLSPDTCWALIDAELDTIPSRPQDPFAITEDEKRLYREFIKPYWEGRSVADAFEAQIPEDVRRLNDASAFFINRRAFRGPGELTADYERVLNVGIRGIRKAIEKGLDSLDPASPERYERATYLKSLLIVCDGIVALARRYAHLAQDKAKAEKDQRRRAELERIADVCNRVPEDPPRGFWEALQSFYFYHLCIQMEQNAPSYNPGRMDQYLFPYYEKDVEEGVLSRDDVQELLDCLWIKLSQACLLQDQRNARYSAGYMMFQNACCGGVTESGQDAVNDLSYMMLQATMDVRLYQPSLSVRYSKGKNPDSFLRRVVDLVALGTGFPSIHNDDIGIRMVMNKGVPLSEAYTWNPCGCVETNVMGKLGGWTDFANINLGTAVECALFNGRQRRGGPLLTVETGEPSEFATFGDFKNAVKVQLAYLIGKAAEANGVVEAISRERRPVPVVSLSFKECVKNARDYERGGAKYNVGNGITMTGIADLVNSLAAVKRLIYEDKSLIWEELLEGLERDFDGHERIRGLCVSAPKYGNDIPAVDELATEVFRFAAEEAGRYRGKRGSMVTGILPVTANIPCGMVVGALPSGRKAWTPLADGLSPAQGTDVEGPTGVLKSVSRIDHAMHPSGTLLNMKLQPDLVRDEKGKRHLMALLKSMCDLGVYHIQFNVVSPETLRDAQEHPEKHRGLLVRVAGYSAYFVELEKAVQDDIIARTTQMSMN